ncbi:hypothetical protein ES705_20773 [subsurface metagenome]
MNLLKWLNIYNSILRLKFYTYLETHNPDVIKEFDSHFQRFINEHGLNTKVEKVKFFGGDILVGLCYLILVRTNEFIKNELNEAEKDIVLQIDNWKIFGVSNFSDITSRYNLTITTLVEKNNRGNFYYTNDREKLEFFIRKLRNAISHHNYDHPSKSHIKLIDQNPNDRKMECIFKYSGFINFCMDFGHMVNDCLYNQINR